MSLLNFEYIDDYERIGSFYQWQDHTANYRLATATYRNNVTDIA